VLEELPSSISSIGIGSGSALFFGISKPLK